MNLASPELLVGLPLLEPSVNAHAETHETNMQNQ